MSRCIPEFRVFLTEIKVQARSGLYAAYAVMTLFFVLILALLPPAYREAGFGLIILMDPSFMGFFFAGGLILLEREQGILPVFLTRGRGFAAYWGAKAAAILALALTVVGVLTGVAWGLGLITPGWFGLAGMALGLLLTIPVFLSLGLVLAGQFPRIVEYFLYASILMLPFMFPLVELFGLSVGWFGVLSPIWGGMVLITSGFLTRRPTFARYSVIR